MTAPRKRTPSGYRCLPQRNGRLAIVKMPTKRPKRPAPYDVRRLRALAYVINIVKKFQLWDEVGAADPFSLSEVEKLR